MARGEIHLDEASKTQYYRQAQSRQDQDRDSGKQAFLGEDLQASHRQDKDSVCRQGASRQAKGPASSVPGKACREKAFELRIRRPEDQRPKGCGGPASPFAGKASHPARPLPEGPGPGKTWSRQELVPAGPGPGKDVASARPRTVQRHRSSAAVAFVA